MKKIKREARCLTKNEGIKDFVIFDDGSRSIINEDPDLGKYYYVYNELWNDPEVPKWRRELFSGRVRDAIETIRLGYGDCFLQKNPTGVLSALSTESVIRLLDRKKGEELRGKTIEGWKNAEFAWGIKTSYRYSFSPGNYLCENDTVSSPFAKDNKLAYFETEEAAKTKMAALEKEVTELVKEYADTPKSGRKQFLENRVKKYPNIQHDLFYGYLDERGVSIDLKVVQLAKI